MTDTMKDHDYLLPQSGDERTRLNTQHTLVRTLLNHPGVLPSSVDLSRVSQVIDIAAGSLPWTLEFAQTPDIKSRLAPGTQNHVHLYACDISDMKFPPEDVQRELGVKTFLHDVTLPFPEEMKGQFDLVHMSFLAVALTEQGWKRALSNIYDIIKPDGILHIWESDLVFYFTPQPQDVGYNLDATMRGSSWLHKLNSIVAGTMLKGHQIPDLSVRLQDLIPAASFEIEVVDRLSGPIGKVAHGWCNERGGGFSPMQATFTAENFGQIVDAMSAAALRAGVLEAPLGTKIHSEEGRRALVQEIKRGLVADGSFIRLVEFIARKP